MIVEPLVQGAAGIVTHPPGYLRAVRELCDRHGVLLICDEVATGFGRTGTMFACEQERVAPDLMCVAKGLTGGYLPLAATLATESIYEAFLAPHEDFKAFFHGHTYTGNPLACAAALGNLDVFEMERTLVRMQPKIRLLAEALREVEAMPEVAEVRQRGFMVGIDLGAHDPALRMGHRVVREARRPRRHRAAAGRRDRADAAAFHLQGGHPAPRRGGGHVDPRRAAAGAARPRGRRPRPRGAARSGVAASRSQGP